MVALAAGVACGPVHAGTPCAPKKADAASFVKAMKLAERTYAALDKSGAGWRCWHGPARTCRSGRAIRMAYACATIRRGAGWWCELNECGSARSALFDEGLGNFFLDEAFAHEQIRAGRGGAGARRRCAIGPPLRLHDPRYNMPSFPFSTDYRTQPVVLETTR
jgi:hypothetical protein